MTDLVKRLRERAGKYDEYDWHGDIELEAADRIEHLEDRCANLLVGNRALNIRIEKLEAALREIASISKIICKSEDMSNALILTLKSHRDLAIKALDDAP
jgi:hypothetical protein